MKRSFIFFIKFCSRNCDGKRAGYQRIVRSPAEIDEIDLKLIEVLDERFHLTRQIGLLKAAERLSSLDSTREAQKLAKLRSLCLGTSLNPDFIQELFSQIMKEVVKNHEIMKR